TLPFTRWGIQYEVFLGRLSYSDRIAWQGGYTSGNPLLAGFRMSVEPVPGWSLAASRQMQYGGGARGGRSWRDLFNAFINTTRYENTTGQLNSNQDFGNQQVAFSSELQVPTRQPLSLYIEYAAEDTFHAENYRFGSGALGAGFFMPELRPNLQLRYEFSEWQTNWYVHYIYQDGMSNHGVVLGNWGADWRRRGNNVGGQSHVVDLSWQLERGDAFNASYRTVQNARGSDLDYRRAHELGLQWTRPWNELEVGAELDVGRDEYGTTFGRLSALARLDGDLRARRRGAAAHSGGVQEGSATRAEAGGLRTSRYERFVDGGMALSHVSYEQDADAVPEVKSFHGSAHLGFGVRRVGDAHSDIGVRMDLDNISGRLFTGLRALDYRYRLSSSLAVTGFVGAARYAALTPAYGWYAGLGAQWRNIFPGWDAGVDVRLGDHLVRNKLSGESVIIWPNEFYTIKGETFYLSRRF
ncbi:MAG: capsule assembly Wzi family protein, partial [Steroidobacteraceae bacterium]